MKFFKNFKTKKQLREENKRLKMLNRPQSISFIEYETYKVSSRMELNNFEMEAPIEIIKKQILHKMADELESFVEWDIEDSLNENRYGKIIRADIYLTKRK